MRGYKCLFFGFLVVWRQKNSGSRGADGSLAFTVALRWPQGWKLFCRSVLLRSEDIPRECLESGPLPF